MSFIEIRNLTIDSSADGIKFTAVNNLSLNVEAGQKVAILSYIDPLVAVVASVLFLREPFTGLQIVGGLLIIGFSIWNER